MPGLLGYSPKLTKAATEGMGLLSAALPSPYGDVVGLAADAAGYAQDPSTLTPARGLLSVAALAPGIPRASTAEWVDSAGKAIRNKQLREALKWIRSEEFDRLDDQISGLAATADKWTEFVPAKARAVKALQTLEKHRGQFFPGPSVKQWYGMEPPGRFPGPSAESGVDLMFRK